MNTSFDTLISAFSDHIPPNSIVEQSLRAVYDLMIKGDTVTAQSILRYINVPDALKSQLLGLNNSVIAMSGLPLLTHPSLNDKSMMEAIIGKERGMEQINEIIHKSFDSIDDTDDAIPIKSKDQNTEVLDTSIRDAFDTIKNDNEQKYISSATQGNPVEEPTMPLLDLATQQELEKKKQHEKKDPIDVPSHQRNELFADVFSHIQRGDAQTPSQPTVDTSQSIPIIHTYAEPEESHFQHDIAQKASLGKSIKVFDIFQKYITKAELLGDSEINTSVLKQWDDMNTQYPEYREHYSGEWNGLAARVAKMTESNKKQNNQLLEDKAQSSIVNTDSNTMNDSSYSDIFPSHGVVGQSLVEPQKKDPVLLESYMLHSGIEVKQNLTITGDSIFRVQSIESYDGFMIIVFTDEVRHYRVPAADLDTAMQNESIDPDIFFKEYLV